MNKNLTKGSFAKTLGLLWCAYLAPIHADSHTFFTPRSVTSDPVFELALNEEVRRHSDERFSLFVKPFVMRSTESDQLARYFMIHNQTCATLRENGTGDINPLWVGLMSPTDTFYSSTICFSPRRTVAGAVLTFYANLDFCCTKLWFEANTALMTARNTLGMFETDRAAEGTIDDLHTACDTFNNPDWLAAKIDCCNKHKKTGLDDIQLKLGYDICSSDVKHWAPYLVASIPTGQRNSAEYLFNPVVGSKHFRLGFGFNADQRLIENERHSFDVLFDAKFTYGLKGTETRTFDLTNNGDWSRYLLVIQETAPLFTIPGNNLFTFPVNVTPRGEINLFLAGHFTQCKWHFEGGYNFWYRQSEKICLKSNDCPTRCETTCSSGPFGTDAGIPAGYGIFDPTTLCSGTGISASTATIDQGFLDPATNLVTADTTFVELTNDNLNLCSAAHPRAISNKVYGAVGYDTQCFCYDILVGVGGSYEFAEKNAINQWAVWLNLGASF